MKKRSLKSGTTGLGFGTIRHHGGGLSMGSRSFTVDVEVNRDIGASTAGSYRAHACVTKRGRKRQTGRSYSDERCGSGRGRGPTAAAKAALAALSRALK